MSTILRSNVDLTSTLQHLWDSALKPNTAAAYQSGFNQFHKFLLLNNCTSKSAPLPNLTEEILEYFVAHCFKNLKIAHATIKLKTAYVSIT